MMTNRGTREHITLFPERNAESSHAENEPISPLDASESTDKTSGAVGPSVDARSPALRTDVEAHLRRHRIG